MSETTTLNTESVLLANDGNFEEIAFDVFRHQYEHNKIYRAYCDALKTDVRTVIQLTDIPFLPISFFKTHEVITSNTGKKHELIFESSKTTGDTASRHQITDASVYERSLLSGFEQFYGRPEDYVILALLPSYLERQNASLVYMAKTLMEKGGHAESGFYINEWEQLRSALVKAEQKNKKVLLLGVTFALLDFAEAYPMPLRNTILMETGGMKGRKEEMTRTAVHEILKTQWQLDAIHSEYGMTELLSQGYARTDGIFSTTHTMRVFVRDINDPLSVSTSGTGALNIIDLANVHSCSFIATEDIGNIAPDDTFEVLGRLDHSALRGCSLMAV